MPITITVVIMTVYVIGGAAIYVFWEDWTVVQACYFTFVTLTTIGFGDLVPGAK